MGRISKRGDRYLRMLLTHGARSVPRAATVATRCGRPLDPLRQWGSGGAEPLQSQQGWACALANKLARICFATYETRSRMRKRD
ncbi:MAG: hypothetical protein U1F35_03295 [Steroidobacteraceae bacterium]